MSTQRSKGEGKRETMLIMCNVSSYMFITVESTGVYSDEV